MDVTQLVELVDTQEHFRSVESRMFLFEHARVVE